MILVSTIVKGSARMLTCDVGHVRQSNVFLPVPQTYMNLILIGVLLINFGQCGAQACPRKKCPDDTKLYSLGHNILE